MRLLLQGLVSLGRLAREMLLAHDIADLIEHLVILEFGVELAVPRTQPLSPLRRVLLHRAIVETRVEGLHRLLLIGRTLLLEGVAEVLRLFVLAQILADQLLVLLDPALLPEIKDKPHDFVQLGRRQLVLPRKMVVVLLGEESSALEQPFLFLGEHAS